MKPIKFSLLLAAAFAVISLSACSTTNDGRTGLRGEICALGYCVTPQDMSAAAVPVPETNVVSGPVVAPATVVSQPAVLERTQTVTTVAPIAPAAPIAYAPAPQLAK